MIKDNIQDSLRYEVKQLKAIKDISYKKVSEMLGMNTRSFYAWLNNNYNLGEEKQRKLFNIVKELREF